MITGKGIRTLNTCRQRKYLAGFRQVHKGNNIPGVFKIIGFIGYPDLNPGNVYTGAYNREGCAERIHRYP
jgi:hypothetical protein